MIDDQSRGETSVNLVRSRHCDAQTLNAIYGSLMLVCMELSRVESGYLFAGMSFDEEIGIIHG